MADNISRMDGPDDPERCQGVSKQGQCINKQSAGSQYCHAHGGNKAQDANKLKDLRNYRLAKWRVKLDHFANSEGIKSLRDEIAILRMVLEERLELCNDATDLVLQSHSISDLIMKIEKLVASCHKLEGSMGQLLDKQAILTFASDVIGIIGDEVTDTEAVGAIADRILATVSNIGD